MKLIDYRLQKQETIIVNMYIFLLIAILFWLSLQSKESKPVLYSFIVLLIVIFVAQSRLKLDIKLPLILLILFTYKVNITLTIKFITLLGRSLNKKIESHKLLQEINDFLRPKFNIITNFDKLPAKQSIIVANYPSSYYDCYIQNLIPGRIAPFMGNNLMTRLLWTNILERVIYRDKKGGSFEQSKQRLRKSISEGYSIFVYITDETTIYDDIPVIGRTRTGMFRIAQELGIPITPVTIDYVDMNSIGAIPFQNIRITVSDTFDVTDPEKDAKRVGQLFRTNLKHFIKTKYVSYLHN